MQDCTAQAPYYRQTAHRDLPGPATIPNSYFFFLVRTTNAYNFSEFLFAFQSDPVRETEQ